MGKIVRRGIDFSGGGGSISNPTASSVTFDNTDTSLNATNVQDAVTEVNGKLLNIVYEDIFQYGTTEKNIKEITNISLFGTYLVTAYVKLAGNDRKTHVKIKLNEQEIAHLEDYVKDGVFEAYSTISAIADISSDTDKITISAYSDKAWPNVNCSLILNIQKITLA